MTITPRQKLILNTAIAEYITSAKPISSQLLEKKCDFDVCSATIRNELQALTDKGYLLQPHTSAGRVPTDKGYRFFVDNWLEDIDFEKEAAKEISEMENFLNKKMEDCFTPLQTMIKSLALASDNLALGYLPEEKILLKEGWKEILQEPEFLEQGYAARFAKMIDDFEENIEDLFSEAEEEPKVFIGKENRIPKASDFSVVVSKFSGPHQKGVFAIVGPKRMEYPRNINLINAAIKLLEIY